MFHTRRRSGANGSAHCCIMGEPMSAARHGEFDPLMLSAALLASLFVAPVVMEKNRVNSR
jgi:hypothetical protein